MENSKKYNENQIQVFMDSLVKVSMSFFVTRVCYPGMCLNFPYKEHVKD